MAELGAFWWDRLQPGCWRQACPLPFIGCDIVRKSNFRKLPRSKGAQAGVPVPLKYEYGFGNVGIGLSLRRNLQPDCVCQMRKRKSALGYVPPASGRRF